MAKNLQENVVHFNLNENWKRGEKCAGKFVSFHFKKKAGKECARKCSSFQSEWKTDKGVEMCIPRSSAGQWQ